MRRPSAPWLILLLLCGSAPLAAQDTGSVRVYRCVGSNGAVSLQDAPCRDGRQEVRDMQRPRDPPPRVVRSDRDPATPAAAPPEREVRYVHVQPPQPIYECIRDDGSRYTSDTSEGNPRWVPVWTSAWLPGRGPGGGPPRPRPLPPIMPMGSGSGSSSGSVSASGGSLSVSGGGSRVGGSLTIGGGSSQWQSEGSAFPGSRQDVVIPAGNVLVRDQCHPLPANEVCSILRDRRFELGRRYNSALQSERDAINREQRGIDARLDRDCRN